MPRSELTREELVAIFATKATAPPPEKKLAWASIRTMLISAQLQTSLEGVIESCVNRAGVDLNTSSWTLLRYVRYYGENCDQYR
jgi:hypothetical protein